MINICFLQQELSYGTINFIHMTCTVIFDLLLKKNTLANGHNYCTVRDMTFIFDLLISFDKAFQVEP